MNVPWDIVIASADVEGRRSLSNILEKQGIDPLATSSVRGCNDILATKNVGLIFCDRMLADGDCNDLLKVSRAKRLRTRIVVTSRTNDWDEYLRAMKLGAFDVIAAPCCPTDVAWMVIQAVRCERPQPTDTMTV